MGDLEKSVMEIKIWGGRGSLPSPITPGGYENRISSLLADFTKWQRENENSSNFEVFLNQLPRHRLGGYGGNTACIEIKTAQQQMIIDGGTGLRPLGYEMLNGPCGSGKGVVHLFFTHFHWDHLMGLPFFTPIFIPGNQIHFYSVQNALDQVFYDLFKKPYFPVPLEQLQSQVFFHTLEPRKPFYLNDLQITPYCLDHPDSCWGYKVESQGKVYSHCLDTECTRMTRDELAEDLPLYQNIDLMLFDAQYSARESLKKQNWGHSNANKGLSLAQRETIKRIVFIHHDPSSSDSDIYQLEMEAQSYYQSQLKHEVLGIRCPFPEIQWSFGYEGQVLKI